MSDKYDEPLDLETELYEREHNDWLSNPHLRALRAPAERNFSTPSEFVDRFYTGPITRNNPDDPTSPYSDGIINRPPSLNDLGGFVIYELGHENGDKAVYGYSPSRTPSTKIVLKGDLEGVEKGIRQLADRWLDQRDLTDPMLDESMEIITTSRGLIPEPSVNNTTDTDLERVE
jgi:hypothetical protein